MSANNTTYNLQGITNAVNYGLLYNGYTILDAREISNVDWIVPSHDDWITLRTYIGASLCGVKMKIRGYVYWNIYIQDQTSQGTNSSKFNVKGSGWRDSSYIDIKYNTHIFQKDTTHISFVSLQHDSRYITIGDIGDYDANKNLGVSVRLLKSSTILTNGQEGIYIGNNGRVYRTICIGTQEWLADNLCETKYRNGNTIPEVTNEVTWNGLTSGALCAYNNNWSNVY